MARKFNRRYTNKYSLPYLRARILFNDKDGSKGEQEIRKILKANRIDFKELKTFKGLKDLKPLRFDFSLEFLGKVICLVEYQGELHFKPIDHFGGAEGFKLLARHDAMKRLYCFSRNLKLFYINYNDDITAKMEEILTYYSIFKFI